MNSFSQENNSKKTKAVEKNIEEAKKNTPKTDKNPSNSTWDGNNYRNVKYKFRVSFPANWEYDNGTAKITLARALERSLGATFSVGVKHLPKAPAGMKISNEQRKNMMLDLFKLQNITPITLIVSDGYLDNFPGVIYEIRTWQKSGLDSAIFLSKQIHCEIKDKQYTLALNVIEDSFDMNMEILWNRFFNSFKFEFTY